ncbi:hypothetical protein TrVE_jg85 [Triparma verrucosa]|uniref:ABM domain-containing protein n=2 Tax=Triparma TaxID=722752 RepID=A0A9W7C396_9STRA|nr:hypothetical protein TrST_g13152 [Triparma strigata]GMI10233.1 hypothetical protein TrVE_jg85 [Triparma verrucosa]
MPEIRIRPSSTRRNRGYKGIVTQSEWDMGELLDSTDEGPSEDEETDSGPCTITLRQNVNTSLIPAFQEWQSGILSEQANSAGYLAATVIREDIVEENYSSFLVILKYSSAATAQAWNQSAARMEWMDKLRKITGVSSTGEATIALGLHAPTFRNVLHAQPNEKGFWWNRRMWLLIWCQVFCWVEFWEYIVHFAVDLLGQGDAWGNLSFHVKLLLGTFFSTIMIDLVSNRHLYTLCRKVGYL